MKEQNIFEPEPGYALMERGRGVPKNASFALTLSDDCMEPIFKMGERIYVQAGAELSEFDAGVFLYEGKVCCRQWCEDYTGAVHLLCANPRRERENIIVEKSSLPGLSVLGKVITRKRLPRPFYP